MSCSIKRLFTHLSSSCSNSEPGEGWGCIPLVPHVHFPSTGTVLGARLLLLWDGSQPLKGGGVVTTPSSSCSSQRARSPCRLFPHPPQPHPSIQNAPEITTPLSANAVTPAGPHGSASVLDPSNPSSTRQRLTFVECKSESLGRLRQSL